MGGSLLCLKGVCWMRVSEPVMKGEMKQRCIAQSLLIRLCILMLFLAVYIIRMYLLRGGHDCQKLFIFIFLFLF